MEKDGATLIGESLKEQKVDYMFGVVGIPIIEVGYGAQLAGINYIGMRNEQAVCLTQLPHPHIDCNIIIG